MNRSISHVVKRAIKLVKTEFRRGLYRLHGCFHDTITIQTKQGRLTMSTRDDGIAAFLFSERQYEYDFSRRAVHFLKTSNFIPRENVSICDIGANIGVISIGLLLAGEVSNGVAAEPEPSNFRLLVKNVKQNGLAEKLICLQMAVGDSESTLTMELSPTNLGDHRIRSPTTVDATERQNESSRQTIVVKSAPLARILELAAIHHLSIATPSLLWIDVQGYEGYVFQGAKAFLASGVPTVSEVWPYGILRSGMSLEQFASVIASTWSDYWIERREKFVRYPVAVFDRYLEELGTDGHFENVIFTKVNVVGQ